MRISCSNCQSAYDIDPTIIPAAGRDVKCSQCENIWHVNPISTDVVKESTPTPAQEPAAKLTLRQRRMQKRALRQKKLAMQKAKDANVENIPKINADIRNDLPKIGIATKDRGKKVEGDSALKDAFKIKSTNSSDQTVVNAAVEKLAVKANVKKVVKASPASTPKLVAKTEKVANKQAVTALEKAGGQPNPIKAGVAEKKTTPKEVVKEKPVNNKQTQKTLEKKITKAADASATLVDSANATTLATSPVVSTDKADLKKPEVGTKAKRALRQARTKPAAENVVIKETVNVESAKSDSKKLAASAVTSKKVSGAFEVDPNAVANFYSDNGKDEKFLKRQEKPAQTETSLVDVSKSIVAEAEFKPAEPVKKVKVEPAVETPKAIVEDASYEDELNRPTMAQAPVLEDKIQEASKTAETEVNSDVEENVRENATDNKPKESRFWTGFVFIICLAILLIAIRYIAEPLSKALPLLAPYLDLYNVMFDKAIAKLVEYSGQIRQMFVG